MKNLLRILLALGATAVAAFAQTGTAIPGGNQSATYVINKPGRYYLAAHRVMTDPNKNAIEIAADDVTLDLNGHTVAFASNVGTGHGIYGKDFQNAEIRGGGIAVTPQMGIEIHSTAIPRTSNVRIIDVRVSQPGSMGIRVLANATTISRCSVDESTHSGIVSYASNGVLITDCVVNKTGQSGIVANSGGSIVKNCVVSNTDSTGIQISENGLVESCHVSFSNKSGAGYAAGITLASRSVARGNTVAVCKTNGIKALGYSVLIEANTVLDTYPWGSPAITGETGGSSGLMINNRYTTGTTLTNQLTNGGGNIAF